MARLHVASTTALGCERLVTRGYKDLDLRAVIYPGSSHTGILPTICCAGVRGPVARRGEAQRRAVGRAQGAGRGPFGRSRARRLAVGLMTATAVLTACGSTVQQGSIVGTTSGQGLGDGTTGGSLAAPSVSSAAPGAETAGGRSPGAGPAMSGKQVAGSSGPQAVPRSGRTRPAGSATSYPGVTATTVSIGVLYATGAEAGGAAVGIPGLTTGDGRAQGQALVNYVNAHGGLAGHRLLPLFKAEDVASTDPNGQDQAICTYFTQDHHVFAVVDGPTGTSNNLSTCLAKAGVTIVDNFTPVDSTLAQSIGGFYYKPSDFQAEREYRTYVTGLVDDGFLTRSSKVGVYYDDTQPSSLRILASTVKPLLARYGIPLIKTAGVNTAVPDASWQSAVLQFNAAHVDRVLGIFANPLFFMEDAQSQQYHPRYGLMSLWAPSTLQTAAPGGQLQGSVGVGWQPYADVDAAHNPGPVSSNETLCKKIMAGAGQSSTSSLTQLAEFETCDVVFFLDRALSGTRTITPRELAARVASLGDGYRSAVTFRTAFPNGRPDGAAAYRIFSYTGSCSCFTYTGPIKAI